MTNGGIGDCGDLAAVTSRCMSKNVIILTAGLKSESFVCVHCTASTWTLLEFVRFVLSQNHHACCLQSTFCFVLRVRISRDWKDIGM